MKEIFDVETWRQVLVSSLGALGSTLAGFLPSLVATFVILAVGWLVSRVVEVLAGRLLRQLGLDRAAGRLRVAEILEHAGIGMPPSAIAARLVFWVLMLTFVLSAVETLGLDAVTATIDRLIAFLPKIIASGLLFLLGLLLARLAGNLVSSGAAAASVAGAQRIGAIAQGVVAVVAGVIALDQLGVQTGIVVTVATAAVAALGLTVGIAFALGAQAVIAHILAGHFLRQSFPPGGSVEIGERRGVVERVGPVDTLLRDGERAWSIPNGRLLDEIVQR
jgi:small-conductance mechanosensitive channel